MTEWGTGTTPDNISDKFTADISSQGIVNKEGDIVQLNAAHSYDTDWSEEKRGTSWNKDENRHCQICTVCAKTGENAHSWDNDKITREPTVEEEGEKTFTCTVCSATKTEPISIATSGTTTQPTQELPILQAILKIPILQLIRELPIL